MKIKISYCKRVRKDGTINSVWFDTETRRFTSLDTAYGFDVFIEAAQSRDVNALRETLRKKGYTEFIDLRKEIK